MKKQTIEVRFLSDRFLKWVKIKFTLTPIISNYFLTPIISNRIGLNADYTR